MLKLNIYLYRENTESDALKKSAQHPAKKHAKVFSANITQIPRYSTFSQNNLTKKLVTFNSHISMPH